MVVRVWRGATAARDADGYVEYLRAYDGYRKTPGYVGQALLRRPMGDQVEFLLLSLRTSIEAIAEYAGSDYEAANLHDRDRAVLTSADLRAIHYTMAFGLRS
jgi:hypothetical protein